MNTRTFARIFTSLFAFAMLIAVSAANAQTIWNGSVDGSWNNASNWNTALPISPPTDTDAGSLTFPTGASNKTNTNNAGVITIGTLTLEDAGWNINLGGSAVTIAGITATGSSTLTGNVKIGDGSPRTITLGGTNTTLEITGQLNVTRANNSLNLAVNGAGNTLLVGSLNIGDGSGDKTISGSANVTVNGALSDTISSSLIWSSTGALTLKGASTSYDANTTFSAGTVDLGGGTANGSFSTPINVTLGNATFNYTRTGGTTQSFTTTAINGAATINVVAENILNLGTVSRGAGGVYDFSSVGAGTVAALAASNDASGIMAGFTYGDTWAVANGAGVAISGFSGYTLSSVAGDTAGNYTGFNIDVDSSQTPDAAITANSLRFSEADANTLTLTGANTITTGGILVGNGVGSYASTITGGTLAGAASKGLVVTQNNTSAAITIGSQIIDNTAASALSKSGVGTLVLTADNTYTGATTISAGALNIQHNTALGTTAGGVTVLSGAALQLQNNITVGAEALTLNGTGVANTGALRNISDTNIYGGAITLGSDSSIQTDAGSLTLNGVVSGSGIALTKSGAGILTLGAANTYTGATTVNAGELRWGINNALSSGGLTVNNGGTANIGTFTDTVGMVTLAKGGQITGSTGVLQTGTGGLALNNGGSISFSSTGAVRLGGDLTYTDSIAGSTTATINRLYAGGPRTYNITRGDDVSGIDLDITDYFGNSASTGSNIIKTGTGVMRLSGGTASSNLSNSTLTIQEGTLLLNKSGTDTLAFNGSGLITVGDGTGVAGTAILRYTGSSDNQLGSNAITILADGLFDLNDRNETLGQLTHSSGGQLTTGAGILTLNAATNTISGTSTVVGNLTISNGGSSQTALTMGGTASIDGNTKIGGSNQVGIAATGTPEIKGNLDLGLSGTPRNITVTDVSDHLTISALVSMTTTAAVNKKGTGTLTLSNPASTFGGAITVQAGSLVAGADAPNNAVGAFGQATSALLLGNGSTLDTDAPAILINGAHTVGRSISVGSATNTNAYNATIGGSNTTGTSTYSGTITLNNTAANYTTTLQAATGGTVDFTGTWNTNNRAINIGSVGNTGNVKLSSVIATTGGINVAFGTLDLNSALTGNLTLASGTTLSGSGSVSGTTIATSATVNGNELTLIGQTTFNGAGNILSGTVTSNAGVLVASDAELAINGTLTGNVTVASGAYLAGIGTVTGNTIISGTHNPGNSPGIETFEANLSYVDGSTPAPVVNWELARNTSTNVANPNAVFDQIVVAGALDFTDLTTLNLIFNSTGSLVLWGDSFWGRDQSWLIYDVNDAPDSTSNFTNLQLGTIGVDSQNKALSDFYKSTFTLSQEGEDIFLNYNFAAIPEPSTIILAGLGLAGLTFRRRRK